MIGFAKPCMQSTSFFVSKSKLTLIYSDQKLAIARDFLDNFSLKFATDFVSRGSVLSEVPFRISMYSLTNQFYC